MSNIGRHAYRLTADCIWNSFRSSGKRHLILTGDRGSGKTTLLSRLFPEGCPGVTTWARPGEAVYLKENTTGAAAQIGAFAPDLPGIENRMVPCQKGFLSLGVPALTRCMSAVGEWVTVDEVGYLEASCAEYQQALLQLLKCKRVAAVVRKQEIPFLTQLRSREDVFLVDLDDPFGDIGCVIMASGMGKRFGGNKLTADFRGEPMLCRVLDATQGIFRRRVVVTRHRDVAELCEEQGIEVILHDLPLRSDTVRLGVENMEGLQRCIFCAADQPLLRRETVQALALACGNEPEYIWRTACEGTPGNPVVFPAWTFEQLRQLPEGKGGSAVIKKYPERLRAVNVRDENELKDVDTPEDLQELLER